MSLYYEDLKSPQTTIQQFSTNILEWDCEKVSRWISYLGLAKYSSGFRENNISGDILVHLNQTDLGDIGVTSVGHRLRILKSIYNIIISQEIEIGPDHYIPQTVLDAQNDTLENSIYSRILTSFQIRDERMALAEGEIKRLMDNFSRLREDLLPIFRKVKESKPLPTPDVPLHIPIQRSTSPPIATGASVSPTYHPHVVTVASSASISNNSTNPQIVKKTSSKKSLNHHVVSASMSAGTPVTVSGASPSRNSHDWLDTSNTFYTGGLSSSSSSSSASSTNTGVPGISLATAIMLPPVMAGNKDSRKASFLSSASVSTLTPGSSTTYTTNNLNNNTNASIASNNKPSELNRLSQRHSYMTMTSSPAVVSDGPTGNTTGGSLGTRYSVISASTARSATPALISLSARSNSASSVPRLNSLSSRRDHTGGPGAVSVSSGVSTTTTTTTHNKHHSSNPSILSGTNSMVSLSGAGDPTSSNASSMHSEPIMEFNFSPDVPCYKMLPLIARRHKVRGDWRGVGLVVCYGDQERMVGLEEKPLAIYKELQREGKNPVFMIREDNGMKTDLGFVVSGTPGGLL